VTNGGTSVKLQLARAGIQNLDVFCKEMSETGGLATATGWKIAESDIPATQTEWVDSGSDERTSVNEVYGRYYLVGNADIDSNSNGIPDARETFCSLQSSSLNGTGVMLSSSTADAAALSNAVIDTNVGTKALSSPVSGNMPGGIIYVDQRKGDDALSGCATVVVGSDGPKKTLKAGLDVAGPGNTMVINSGNYGENLNIAGRDISVVIAGNVDISGHSASLSILSPQVPQNPTNIVNVSTNSIR